MTGLNSKNAAVEGNTNFLLDEGSGNGTITRPLTVSTATAGAWGTWANQNTDMTKLIANHEAHEYNVRSSILMYPKCASYAMKRGSDGTRAVSAIEFALSQGVLGAVAVPNAYMWTVANAAPAIGAFDLALVDISQIRVGYTRMPRFRTIAPHDSVRDTVVQGETWFVPFFKPNRMDVTGTEKVFKGVSVIPAINGA